MHNGSLRGPREDTLPNAVIQEVDICWTALHEAAATGDDRQLQTILAANADRSCKESKHGNTALHECAWRGYSRCVKLLCALPIPKKELKDKKLKGIVLETRGSLHSALLSIKNDGGFSPLHLAAQNGHNQSCREILLAGADPDVQNNHGDTPLHTACRYGHAGATRILLSASCNPNKSNLNGDTPLHIACAMGRRKLTRILLEAGSSKVIKNAQNETPRDIAIRKHYREILDILDNPLKTKSRRDKDKSSGSGGVGGGKSSAKTGTNLTLKGSDQLDLANIISWSPYGCHYFPDPREFPSPKLETLPKEPLQKGEQYFLDLAGNIRKGPVGVGNNCYCGPFFKHMEDKINRNRRSLRKYVFKATERLDSKVQALALRTDDQIEQLTRSMIADRIRCESRRIHLEHWLKRGEPYRLTTGHHHLKSRKKSKDANSTLTRSRSLEFLDNDGGENTNCRLPNSRSYDLLEQAPVTVHRAAENSDDNDGVDRNGSSLSAMSIDQVTNFDGERRWDGFESDYQTVSERLEELLAKTNEILEMEKEASKRRKDELLAFTEPSTSRRKERQSHGDLMSQSNQLSRLNVATFGEESHRQTTNKNHENDVGGATSAQSQYQMEGIKVDDPSVTLQNSSQPIEDENINRSPDQSFDNAYVAYIAQLQPGRRRTEISACSSGASNVSQNSASLARQLFHQHQDENHNFHYQNFSQIPNNEHMLQDVITALRKDHQRIHEISEAGTLNESENTYEDKLSYKGDQTLLNNVNGLFQNVSFEESSRPCTRGSGDDADSPDNTLKSEKVTMTSVKDISELCERVAAAVNPPLPQFGSTAYAEMTRMQSLEQQHTKQVQVFNTKCWKGEKPLKNNNKDYEDLTERVSGTMKKVEIKNSEIKTLKKPSSAGGILKRSKVQELVARLQGKLTTSSQQKGAVVEMKQNEKCESESSEDEQNEHNESRNEEQIFQHSTMSDIEPLPLVQSSMVGAYSSQAQPQQIAAQISNNTGLQLISPAECAILSQTSAALFSGHMQMHTQQPQTMGTYLPERIIPKDAYFHELPNKNRNLNITSGRFSNEVKFTVKDNGEHPLNVPNNYYHHHNSTSLANHLRQQTTLLPERRPISRHILPPHLVSLNATNNPAYSMPPIMIHQPPQPLRAPAPIIEKLLSNRKFTSLSGSPAAGNTSPDYEIASLKNCNQLQNLHLHQHPQLPMTDALVVERDTSNDSGFSTRMYSGGGGSHRPSPSLSGQTDYTSGGMQSPTTVIQHFTNNSGPILTNGIGDSSDDVGYYVGNVSSLV